MNNFCPPTSVVYLDSLFSQEEDLSGFRMHWFELRKHALIHASLPAARYGNVYKPGCGSWELAAGLATRCDRLLVSGGADDAVGVMRERLTDFENVRVIQAGVPEDWPDEQFDLIVINELAYYLNPDEVLRLVGKISTSLQEGGTMLACHERKPLAGCPLNGDQVHDQFHTLLEMPHVCKTEDANLRIDVWCLDARTVT